MRQPHEPARVSTQTSCNLHQIGICWNILQIPLRIISKLRYRKLLEPMVWSGFIKIAFEQFQARWFRWLPVNLKRCNWFQFSRLFRKLLRLNIDSWRYHENFCLDNRETQLIPTESQWIKVDFLGQGKIFIGKRSKLVDNCFLVIYCLSQFIFPAKIINDT